MTPIGHEEAFTIEGSTITFHNLTDVGTASGEAVHPLASSGAPFQQPNEPGSLQVADSLEDVCDRAQQAVIRTLRLFGQD